MAARRSEAAPEALAAWRRLLRAVRRRERTAEQESGLTGAQLFALRQLAAHPGATMGELATLTATDASSISVVVARLVAARLVRRERDPADGRRWRLALTRTGAARLAQAPDSADRRLADALAALPAADRRRLAGLLARLADAVE